MFSASKIKNTLEDFAPDSIIELFDKFMQPDLHKIKHKIKEYFLCLDAEGKTQDPEIAEVIDYFKKNRYSAIPYQYIRNYHASDIKVFYDKENKMFYVHHNNKRLYFPENFDKENVKRYYNGLLIEQDKDSPHRYENDWVSVTDGDIIADIGAAEGIWSLDNVEKADKIYLFECKGQWVKALEKTFEPWRDKITVVNKYVSNINNDTYVTLDKYFIKDRINFIKADIEGMEIQLLEGSDELIKRENNLKFILCTYHRKNDAENLKEMLESGGYKTKYSKRFLFNIDADDLEEPYIRRGIIYAKKND
jgi:hypothetical protein